MTKSPKGLIKPTLHVLPAFPALEIFKGDSEVLQTSLTALRDREAKLSSQLRSVQHAISVLELLHAATQLASGEMSFFAYRRYVRTTSSISGPLDSYHPLRTGDLDLFAGEVVMPYPGTGKSRHSKCVSSSSAYSNHDCTDDQGNDPD